MINMKTAVVTGPTGAIGTALIECLTKEGVKVFAVCRPESVRIERIPQNDLVTIIRCPLAKLENLPELINEKADVFYHLAWSGTAGDARNNAELQCKNIEYSLSAVKAAKNLGCECFVGAGSQAEYGIKNEILGPDTPLDPVTGYGIAKLCSGQITRLLAHRLDMRHVWLRVLSVYGPKDGENSMIMSVTRKLLNGECPQLTKGEQIWDYLFSFDAAQAFMLAGERGADGKTYCLGSGKGVKLKQYIELLRDSIDPSLPLDFGAIHYSDNQVLYLCADISELTKDTGFVPSVSFCDGIKETIEWCRNNPQKYI